CVRVGVGRALPTQNRFDVW
nr:immunoglobulin heavy chain junction region [Macaca mulatta]MOW87769.1 immunoglobulin heavy chain junction region [Macaca mulatta]MOW88639.1 immunoglobulin heavy chain junction region [Macaca mulatta]MOW89535.1 immunoglobulin heavy chain junction region [Macaca mulatta]MOW90961.1 immunoglobulin heavy chain junction region [Macaca mulatta]